jgi:hypothetical protein
MPRADLRRVHVGDDGYAEMRLVDVVAGQEFALAFGRGAAVRPHRGDDERVRAEFLQRADGRLGDGQDVLDPATAAPDGDLHAGLDALGGLGGEPLTAHLRGHVGDRGLRGGLADELNVGNVHGSLKMKDEPRMDTDETRMKTILGLIRVSSVSIHGFLRLSHSGVSFRVIFVPLRSTTISTGVPAFWALIAVM